MEKLKRKISEFVEIAKECPENLQQICFEVLLRSHLEAEIKSAPQKPPQLKVEEKGTPEPKSVVEESSKTQEDLSDSDIHVKAKRFLNKYGLSVTTLNQLYYKENGEIFPLYDDLKTTKTSESQIRITILQCLLSAIKTGDFSTEVETARQESKTRKCYDKNNWAGNYTNNAGMFDFEKYSREIAKVTLSEDGKAELANVVKEMQ